MTDANADEVWAQRYPALFTPHLHSWDHHTRAYLLQLTLQLPPDQLVVNVRLIATVGEKVVVCQTREGWRTLPGGSREQGERIQGTARRELMEEAGCAVRGDVGWIASFTVTNRDKPWRSWHPSPITAWVVGRVDVDLVGPPTNPADGEDVVAVHTLSPLDARDYLAGFDNGGQADLIGLAIDLGHL